MNNRILGALLQGLGGGIKAAPDIFNQTAGLNWDAQTKALSLAEMLQQNAWQRGHGDATLALNREMYENPNASSFQELFTQKAQRGGLNQMLGYPEPNLVGPPSPLTGDQERAREIYAYSLQGRQGSSYSGRAGANAMGPQDMQDAWTSATKYNDEMRTYALIQAAGLLPNAEGGQGVTTKSMNDIAAMMTTAMNGIDFANRVNGAYGGNLSAETLEGLTNAWNLYLATYDPNQRMQTFYNMGNMWQGNLPNQEDWFSPNSIPKMTTESGLPSAVGGEGPLGPNPWGQKISMGGSGGGGLSSGFNFGFRQPMTFAGGGGMLQPTTQPPVQQLPRSPGVVPTEKPAPTQKPAAQKSSNLVAAIRAVKADLAEPGARITDPAAYWQAIAEEFPGIDIAAVKRATGQK